METLELIRLYLGMIGGVIVGVGTGEIILYLYKDKEFVKKEWKLFAGPLGLGIVLILISLFI